MKTVTFCWPISAYVGLGWFYCKWRHRYKDGSLEFGRRIFGVEVVRSYPQPQ
jgi:hypothetical protein